MKNVRPFGAWTRAVLGDAILPRPLTIACAVWCCLSPCVASLLAGSAGPSADAPEAAPAERWSAAAAVPPKVRRYAERLLRRYDVNGDGQLQSDEWSKMQGSPEAADANHDHAITLDEWTRYLAAFGRSRRIGSASPDARAISDAETPPRQSPPSEGPSSKAAEGDRKTAVPGAKSRPGSRAQPPREARFYVPRSRLPAGLPPWFLQRDTNGDGQVSLSEFAPDAAQTALQEFLRYDKNGDGFITPQECCASPKPTKTPSGKTADAKSGETQGKDHAKPAP